MDEVSIFAPLKNERDSVSAEELLDKHKHYNLLRYGRKKLLIFLLKKIAGSNKVSIFAVPITGSAGVERLRL